MKTHVILTLTGSALLAGCQSNVPYQRIGAGPALPYAEAQCNILAAQTQQGMIAFGSPSYVAGAQLGNAIGNAIRAEEFKKNCMVMQGWARVAPQPTVAPGGTAFPPPPPKAKNTAATQHLLAE